MISVVILGAGPLGLLAYPITKPEAARCDQWLQSLLGRGIGVVVPEIADFEVRRELLRLRKSSGVRRLDELTTRQGITLLPIRSDAMRLAAAYWATARQAGRPTADPHALDCDVVLAAQARVLGFPDDEFIVATTNRRHLGQFVPAAEWWTITGDAGDVTPTAG